MPNPRCGTVVCGRDRPRQILRHDCSESETFMEGGILSRVDGVGGENSAMADLINLAVALISFRR